MTNQDMDFLARKIVSLENKHNALARARQLPNSSVRLNDGSDVSMRDSVESGRDNRSAIEQLEGATTGIGSITDTGVENAVSVPDWFNELGVGVDVAWDSTQFAMDLALELEEELGPLPGQITQATEDAAEALGAAQAVQNRINDEVLPAIDDAAASPITDERLTEGSLTVWPFQNSTVPAGALEPGAVRSTDIADFAVTAKKFSTNRLHVFY